MLTIKNCMAPQRILVGALLFPLALFGLGIATTHSASYRTATWTLPLL